MIRIPSAPGLEAGTIGTKKLPVRYRISLSSIGDKFLVVFS
jgi:hypothetical protein